MTRKGIIIYALLLSILFSIGTYFKFSINHERLPQGCDDFGYFNMAEAFSNDVTFKDHTPRSFFKGLTATLKQEGLSEQEYVWLIVPHAYHVS